MNILLIGFGSIGARHYELLNNQSEVTRIDIVSRSKKDALYSTLDELNVTVLAHYDLFFICSETCLHEEQLRYLDSNISGKIILVEKPLYAKALLIIYAFILLFRS